MKYITIIILSLFAVTALAQNPSDFVAAVNPADYSGQLKIIVVELAEQDDELFMDIEVRMTAM